MINGFICWKCTRLLECERMRDNFLSFLEKWKERKLWKKLEIDEDITATSLSCNLCVIYHLFLYNFTSINKQECKRLCMNKTLRKWSAKHKNNFNTIEYFSLLKLELIQKNRNMFWYESTILWLIFPFSIEISVEVCFLIFFQSKFWHFQICSQ